MWPFTSSSSNHLPQAEQEHLRKRLRSERKAYQACLKAHGGDGTSCRQLEVRLLERYSELASPLAAAEYQACYTASLARGDIVLDTCSKQVEEMRGCLKRLGIDVTQ